MLRLKLDQLLFERNMSALQVAELSGIRYSTVLDMRSNHSKVWSPEHLDKLMEVFNLTSIEQLIEYYHDDQTILRQIQQQLDTLNPTEQQQILDSLVEKYSSNK